MDPKSDLAIGRLSDLKSLNGPTAQPLNLLLAIKLNNQLLIHRQLNIFALGQREHPSRVIIAIHFQPVGLRAVAGKLLGHFQDDQLLAVLANGNFLARTHFIRRNVDLAIVHRNMSVPHQLPRLAPGLREARSIDHIVQPPFQLLQQQFAGHAPGARGLFEIVAELAFQREVYALGLLLLAQLQAVANYSSLAVLPLCCPESRELRFSMGHLSLKHFCAFEEKLHALAAAQIDGELHRYNVPSCSPFR